MHADTVRRARAAGAGAVALLALYAIWNGWTAPSPNDVAGTPAVDSRAGVERAQMEPADKIQAFLRVRLDQRPNDRHGVTVRFSGPVSEETLESLGLTEELPGIGKGRFDRAGILRLAERKDVERIELMPEMRPF